ncbi:O-antigen ligase family protein [Desulfoluna butyratoxydans]|uniref:O-antigen ligase-related n=1 Tax=Desulfoluna butyratoxydans TaxID=231438 RepID=A0A4U8YRM2_9BACT|nr:O-antigen ligase family protein [Desulfoluna butyratoxydans]VFQ44442.1 o-antigen ligase-related [Desulfoluna butyratoxydans]
MSNVTQPGLTMERGTQHASWFFFTMMYLVVDYGRPQVVLPIAAMRPALILTLVLCFYLLINGYKDYLQYRQVWLMGLFILLLAAYVPFVRNQYYSFMAFKTQLLYMPFVLSLIVCVDSVRRLRTVMTVGVILSIYIGLYSMTHGWIGPGHYFHDQNDLSLYMNMWFPISYYLYATERSRSLRLLFLAGVGVGLLTVVGSMSRGGFVGLLAVCLAMCFFSKRRALSLTLVALACVAVVLWVDSGYIDEMATITDLSESTADTRLKSWAAGWRMFLDNPLGVGGNNYPIRFPEYQGNDFQRSMWGRAAHSLWFTLIPETGIIGTLLYLLLVHANVKDVFWLIRVSTWDEDWDEDEGDDDDEAEDRGFLRALGLGFIVAMVGFFASATFISVLYYAHFWYLTGLIIVTVNVAEPLAEAWEPSEASHGAF